MDTAESDNDSKDRKSPALAEMQTGSEENSGAEESVDMVDSNIGGGAISGSESSTGRKQPKFASLVSKYKQRLKRSLSGGMLYSNPQGS